MAATLAGLWVEPCRELVAHLFDDDPDIERCETLPVFDAVKLGLAVPTRPSGW